MKLAKGSTPWVSVPMLLTAFLAAAGNWYMSAVAMAGLVFMIFFHRDPDRIPLGDGMLSPADGKIIQAASDRVVVFMAPPMSMSTGRLWTAWCAISNTRRAPICRLS